MSRAAVAEDRQVKPRNYEEAASLLHRRAPLNCLALADLRDALSKRPAIERNEQ